MKTKKILALALAAVLLVAVGVGGTLAWLAADTDPVVNEFTTTSIDVELEENEDGDNSKENHQFQMVPGAILPKDPIVTVINEDVDVYLFVKITESENLDDYIEYVIADGWTELTSATTETETVIYRTVASNATDKEFSIIATQGTDGTKTNDTVKVIDSLKQSDMTKAQTNVPTLSFQAYVIQSENLTSDDMATIWSLAQRDAE